MSERVPPAHPIIGPEGLAQDLEGLARQLSAVEKQAESQNLAGREVAALNRGHLRELMDLHIHYIDTIRDIQKTNHDAQHTREDEAVRVALETLDNRLAGFPAEFAGLPLVKDLSDRMTRFESAVTGQLNQIEKRQSEGDLILERRIVDGIALIKKELGEGLSLALSEARAQGRPGQDVVTQQAAHTASQIAAARNMGIAFGLFGMAVGLVGILARFLGG